VGLGLKFKQEKKPAKLTERKKESLRENEGSATPAVSILISQVVIMEKYMSLLLTVLAKHG